MKSFPIDSEGTVIYELWYNIIIESALRAGAVIFDGMGNIEKFHKKIGL